MGKAVLRTLLNCCQQTLLTSFNNPQGQSQFVHDEENFFSMKWDWKLMSSKLWLGWRNSTGNLRAQAWMWLSEGKVKPYSYKLKLLWLLFTCPVLKMLSLCFVLDLQHTKVWFGHFPCHCFNFKHWSKKTVVFNNYDCK